MKLHSLGRIFSLVALLTLVFALTFAVSVTANAEGEAQSEIKITVIRDENDNFAKTEPALTSAEGKVKLDWAKVDGAVRYLIYKNGEHIVNSLSDHYVASGLTIGQNVTFTVHAVNASGKVLATGTVEFAADHSWNITTVDPTCVLDGSMTYDCKYCDATKTETLTKLGHLDDIPHAAVSPTCTETGLTAGVQCSRCNVMTTPQQVVAANGHTEVVDAAVAPTCTETGLTAGKHCSVCNTTLVARNVVPALGHTAGTPVKENNVDPTCTTAGGYDMATYCTVCEAETSRVHTDLAALGHKGGTATCTDKAVCEVCSVPYGNLLPHINATPVEENRTEPDCVTVGGYDTVVYCTECNAELSRVHTVLPAKGHTEGAAVEENRVEPTCTKRGSYYSVVYCTDCNAQISRTKKTISSLGHTGGTATCTTEATCTRCGASYGSLKPHVNGTPVEENRVEPDCVNTGSYDIVVYCINCNGERSRESFEIPALGHNYVEHDAKAPNCLEKGWDAYKTCTSCDYTTYHELAPLGHDMQPNEDPKAAIVKGICERCGEEGEFVKIQFPPAYKVPAIVGGCVAVIIFCIIALTRPATTTPWWKRKRR